MPIVKHTNAVKGAIAAVVCGPLLFGLLSCTQGATPPEAGLVGTWAGSVKIEDQGAPHLMVVDMRVDNVALGVESGSLHYGAPRHCEIALSYSGQPDPGVYQFALNKSHGGYCDRLQDGRVDVKLIDARRVSFQVTTKAGASVDAGDMAKQ